MDTRGFDYIVIGAGIIGSWSAYHLSKKGYRVLLLDQVIKSKLNLVFNPDDVFIRLSVVRYSTLKIF